MKKLISGILILFSLVVNSGLAQQNLESQIKALENEMDTYRQQQYDLLSPENYKKASEYIAEVKQGLIKGKKLKDLQKKIEKAGRYLSRVNDMGTQGKILFRPALDARKAALEARAPEIVAEEFLESEKLFLEACKKLEKGDLNGARKKGGEAENAFRKAEIKAIKEVIIGNVRELLQKAERDKISEYAPQTLLDARRLYDEAISVLENDRYNKSSARELAAQAEYQVKHAYYLAALIEDLKKNEEQWELVIRNFEERLDQIAEELGFNGHYEEGLDATQKDILLAIRNLKEENKSLKEDLAQLQTDKKALEERIQQYENTVVTELQKKKEWEAKLKKIEKMFTRDEAQVLLSGDQMVIRLYGLTFRSGTAVIMPEHFMLLTKVMRALREFPDRKILVAGHTDSQGNDAFNLNLSENRAAAVRAYLEANMGLSPDLLKSVGYGESKPIASNETPEGRKLNRRIEIIIDLERR